MDRSGYTQRVNTSQMQSDLQHDLQNAVTDAEVLLRNFEMEAVGKLQNQVQGVVTQYAVASEERLINKLVENCNRAYRQLYEKLIQDNKAAIDTLVAQIITQQQMQQYQMSTIQQQLRQFKRNLQIAFLIAGFFAVATVIMFIFLFISR